MQDSKNLFAINQGGKNFKAIFLKYFSYYPLFTISLLLCLGAAFYYIRTTPAKYMVYNALLVRGNAVESRSSNTDLIESALNGKREISLHNEVVMLKADQLMQRVVAKYGFNVSYFLQGRVLMTDVSEGAPFRLVGKDIKDSSQTLYLILHKLTTKGGSVSLGPEKTGKTFAFFWNQPFTLEGNRFILESEEKQFAFHAIYIAKWLPVPSAASIISSKFSVSLFDSKTNILQLNLLTENLERGKAILNAICKEYNLSDIEERSRLSERTVRFIDERLSVISEELRSVEGNLESYQGSRNLIDIKTQAEQSFGNENEVSNNIKQLNIQQGIVSMINSYFSKPPSSNKLVPSSMGLNDETLATLIAAYNELQLRREREAPSMGTNSLAMQDMNAQIETLKGSILENLRNISANLRLQESRLQGHNAQYKQFLASVPHNERVMQEIKRKQSITEGLYLYLLQKREEAAISSTSASISNYKQVDDAKGYGPVEPNSRNIYLYTVLLGFVLPVGIIYLRDLLNDKISNRDDIARKIQAPIIADLFHVPKAKERRLSGVTRSLLSEQFRSLRTSLGYLNNTRQTILVTSSGSGEGKSFVSLNLAIVLAAPGKKVALLEMDIRRPSLSETLGFEQKVGITDFLIVEDLSLPDILCSLPQESTLHIYPAGSVPQIPGDVFLSDQMIRLFGELKKEYEYIVIDSAPAGLVSDAFLLSHYADITLYIMRQRATSKRQLDFLNDILQTGKLQHVGAVLNDVKTGAQYGYNDYGYKSISQYYNGKGKDSKFGFLGKKGKEVRQ